MIEVQQPAPLNPTTAPDVTPTFPVEQAEPDTPPAE